MLFSYARFSACNRYRYLLQRVWNWELPRIVVAMLNPSNAGHEVNDPTITRVITRCASDGFGQLDVVNMYGYRSPYPKDLVTKYNAGYDIVGKENMDVIASVLPQATCALVAWGNHPLAHKRDRVMLDLLYHTNDVRMLELTNDGFPKHPLHVAYSVPVVPYAGRFAQK